MLENITHGCKLYIASSLVIKYVSGSNTSRCSGIEPTLLPPNREGPGEQKGGCRA